MDPTGYLQAAKYASSQGEDELSHSLCKSLIDEHPNSPEADEARRLLGGATDSNEPNDGAESADDSKSSARAWGMGFWTVLAILAGIGVVFVEVVVAMAPTMFTMMFTIILAGGAASGGSSVANLIPDPEFPGIIVPGLLIVGVIWIGGMALFKESTRRAGAVLLGLAFTFSVFLVAGSDVGQREQEQEQEPSSEEQFEYTWINGWPYQVYEFNRIESTFFSEHGIASDFNESGYLNRGQESLVADNRPGALYGRFDYSNNPEIYSFRSQLDERAGQRFWYSYSAGIRTTYFRNGSKMTEYNRNTGLHTEWFENGQKKAEGTYLNGQPDGITIVWYENGQKKYEENFVNGQFDSWYENGQKKGEGNLLNGRFDEWHANGQKSREESWLNGQEDGLHEAWFENGQKSLEENWVNGQREGLQTRWHANGQKLSEGNWLNGREDGLREVWYENGQKRSEINWVNGALQSPITGWDEEGNCISGCQ